MNSIFFDDTTDLFRIVIVGVCAYAALLCFLRAFGNRTLAKMNAFDFVVTVALGSTLATIILNKDVSLAEGALALLLLIALQFLISWSSVRAPWVRRLLTGEPVMLLYEGQALDGALLRARVSKDELRAAVRSAGVYDIQEVKAVVLETDGSFSVVTAGNIEGEVNTSLSGVRMGPAARLANPTIRHSASPSSASQQ